LYRRGRESAAQSEPLGELGAVGDHQLAVAGQIIAPVARNAAPTLAAQSCAEAMNKRMAAGERLIDEILGPKR
jgi:hypothetical protein